MGDKVVLATILLLLLFPSASAVVINEFAATPKSDWDGDGSVSTSKDEFIEFYNPSGNVIDLSGWYIIINDSTVTDASIQNLTGNILEEGYKVILKPDGGLNTNGNLKLYNNLNQEIDSVSYGTWNDGNTSDNAPSGSSTSIQDECIARIPNGADTDNDKTDFQKTICTFNRENKILEDNEQGLEVTILGKIVLEILPRFLNFGAVQPGSQNNPALNGPITFNATGSGTDVNVEITEVIGEPFASGLKIDGQEATGFSENIECNLTNNTCIFNIVQVTPTLNIPEDALPGPAQGTIIYTISGPTP